MQESNALSSLPRSIHSEQIVLGKLLTEPERYWPQIEGQLSEDDFFKASHRLIFHASQDLFHRGKAADNIGVTHYLEEHHQLKMIGSSVYLLELMDKGSEVFEDIAKYAEIIHRKAGMRRLAAAGMRINTIGIQGNGNLGLAQEEALDILNSALIVAEKARSMSAAEVGKQFIEKVKRMRTSQRAGVTTGFKSLDRYIMDMESQLVVVAGSVSVGKTLVLLNMAYQEARAGIPTAFITLEMSLDALIKRIIQRANDLAEKEFRFAPNDKLEGMLDAVKALPLFLTEPNTSTIGGIMREMRRLVYAEHVKVIHIDYLQLIQGPGNKQRFEELGDIMQMLLHFALKEKVAIVVGSQINRQAMQTDDKRPKLWMLRSSGEIENSADVVLGLFRKGYIDYNFKDNEMEIHILKNRNGRAGETIKLFCDLDKQKLADITFDHEEPAAQRDMETKIPF